MTSRAAMVATLLAGLAAGLAARPAVAQEGNCFPPEDSNEAKTFGLFSVPLAFGRGAAPEPLAGFRVGLEGVYIPNVDDETATPTFCRPGKGPENTNLLSAVPRPRFGAPLPGGFMLEASWIPPVRLNGVKANLFGVSVGRSFGRWTGLVVAIRGHATFGSIHGPFTCNDDDLADPTSECFEGTRSDDRYRPNIIGADVSAGWMLAGGRFRPYVGAGYNRLMPRFQVHFVDRAGELDRRRVEVDLNRGVFFGGATWMATARLGVSGEIYAAPADAVTGRLVVRTSVGP